MSISILNIGVFKIDHDSNTFEEIQKNSFSNDLNIYITELIETVTNNANKRNFKFESDTTQVKKLVDDIDGRNFKKSANDIIKRLLSKEIDAQEAILKLNREINKGIVFVCHFKDVTEKMIITKNDHYEILDEIKFIKTKGLPTEKKIYKAFLYTLKSKNAYVLDTNTTMAKYWWREFLELSEIYTDEQNTKTFFDQMENAIFKKIKKSFPADHLVLRNATIKELKTKSQFVLTDYLDFWENYQPVNSDFPLSKHIEDIKRMSKKEKFDTQFSIDKNAITARIIDNKINLNDKFDLIIKNDIDNFSDYVKPIRLPNGEKYIQIKSDVGFDTFNNV